VDRSRYRTSVVFLLGLVFALLSATPAGPVFAETSRLVGSIGIHFVVSGETLLDIARDNNLGILEVMAANPGLDPWIPREGSPVFLPGLRVLPDAPHRGIVINLAERRLYFFSDSKAEVRSWPIGVGRLGFTTPLGSTRIVKKKIDPIWYPTAETRADDPELPAVVPPGPDNPMGGYALYLGWPQYAVHGTNRPWGIGRRVSRGCIRLYPEDIEVLFDLARVGMRVTVVDQIAKLAWHEGRLYLEVHPSKAQLDNLEELGNFEPEPIDGLLALIKEVAGEKVDQLDLARIRRAERERLGTPISITKQPLDQYQRRGLEPGITVAP
jgi:L,D-transpeptidase ErfK/SrfK